MNAPTPARFIQIHTLHTYPAVLLNRDDSGLAKRMPFGGTTRTRISSQCLKKHWRDGSGEWSLKSLNVPMGVRSRKILDYIFKELLSQGIERSIAEETTSAFLKAIFQESAKTKKNKKETTDDTFSAETAQAVLFGWQEVRYFADTALNLAKSATSPKDATQRVEDFFKEKKEVKKILEAMNLHAGLESALFGRMVTSDVMASKDASIHVAHAFTVHSEDSESDYFTVVDDLKSRADGDDSGSAGIFDTELTSGLYYGYVVIDVAGLVANINGVDPKNWANSDTDRELAGKVIQHLIHLIAKESPGAKKGSTAPYSWSELTLIEVGSRQPRTLANAFRESVPQTTRGSVFGAAVQKLEQYLTGMDECYGIEESRCLASPHGISLTNSSKLSFNDMAAWVANAITEGRA